MVNLRIISLITYDVFRLSFGWALESLGHEVYHLNTIREDLLEEAIRVFDPEILVTMGWDVEHLKKEKIAPILKNKGVFHLYFAEEDYLQFDNWSRPYVLATFPQFVLTRGQNCIEKYKELGIKAAYLDVGCAPEFHRPMPPDSNYICEVSVVDHLSYKPDIFLHKSISDLVIPLFNQPFDTKIWGKKWESKASHYFGVAPPLQMTKGKVPFRKTPTIYSSSKINISPQSVYDQISNRTYDILSSGGFLLTSDTPGVREKLKPGIHCEVSKSPEETIEKIQYYLANEDKRIKLAKAGCEYAREKFAYKNTLPTVWPQIEEEVKEYRSKTSIRKEGG